jgi:hypothetical protein
MIPLPQWMRRTLLATAVANLAVAAIFLPAAQPMRALAGFPEAPPFYQYLVALFIALFGLGYLWMAILNRGQRLFIAISAIGKLSFFALTVHLWNSGDLPVRVPVLGAGDLLFAALFAAWLVTARAVLARAANVSPVVPV